MKFKRFFAVSIIILASLFNGSVLAHAQSPLGMYYVNVQPDSYYKFRGDSVTFFGSHFYPGETVYVIKDGIRIDTVVANSSGNFETPAYQVASSDEKPLYSFFGTSSFLYQTVQITVSGGGAWLTLSSYYAPAGSLITIFGHNFSKREPAQVWFDGIYEGAVTTNSRGDFVMTIRVPEGGTGQRILEAVGTKSGIHATQTFSQA